MDGARISSTPQYLSYIPQAKFKTPNQSTQVQETTSAQDLADKIGDDPSDVVTGFLQMHETNSLALASKNHRAVLQNLYADRIDPKYLGKGDPIKLYAGPENRKKQYICADQAGKEYLYDLGIKNPDIIAKISDPKNVEWTVDFAIDFLETAAERIGDTNPEFSSKRIDLLMDNSHCPYLAKGLLTEQQMLALENSQIWVLSQSSVQNAVNNGVLTMQQALEMTQYGTYALGNPAIQKALNIKQLNVDDIVHLSAEGWAMHDSAAVKKYIRPNMLTLAAALQLSAQDANDLALPNVQKQLDSGAMDMQDFLNLTHDQRLELPAT